MPRDKKKPIAAAKGEKRPTTVLLDPDLWEWMQKHVPRDVSTSSFINQAVRDKITASRR